MLLSCSVFFLARDAKHSLTCHLQKWQLHSGCHLFSFVFSILLATVNRNIFLAANRFQRNEGSRLLVVGDPFSIMRGTCSTVFVSSKRMLKNDLSHPKLKIHKLIYFFFSSTSFAICSVSTLDGTADCSECMLAENTSSSPADGNNLQSFALFYSYPYFLPYISIDRQTNTSLGCAAAPEVTEELLNLCFDLRLNTIWAGRIKVELFARCIVKPAKNFWKIAKYQTWRW